MKVQALSRDCLWRLLAGVPGLLIPPTVRTTSNDLKSLVEGRRTLEELLPGGVFPVLLRPMDSHGGKGLARLSGPDELANYLSQSQGEEYYLSPFI